MRRYLAILLSVALLLILLLLISSYAAFAQSPSLLDRIMADGRVTGEELRQLQARVPWTGSYVDPLAPMARWDSVLDPSICTSSPPPGWGTAEYTYRVMNETAHPIALRMESEVVDIVLGEYPAMVLAATRRGVERFTALPPGRSCFGIAPYREPAVRERSMFAWKLEGHRLAHRGPPGVLVDAGMVWLYTAPLFDGDRKVKRFAPIVGGKKSFEAVFRDRDFS